MLDLDIRTETIEVAGGDPVTIRVRSTAHGPLISDASDYYRCGGRGGPGPPAPTGRPRRPGRRARSGPR